MRKNVLKKITAFTLLTAVTAVSLLGCGKKEKGTDDVTPGSTETKVTTITAVTGGGPRPMVYYGEDEKLTGYDTEVLRAAFDLLPEYEVDFVVSDRDSMFAGLNAGTYDIGFNNFSYSQTRAENYLFSYPYNSTEYVFVYKDDAEPITSFETAAGKTFEEAASVAATLAVEAWNEKFPEKKIKINYSDSAAQVKFQRLSDGAFDFLIYAKTMYDAYSEAYGITNLTTSPVPAEEVELIAGDLNCYFLLAKDDVVLRDRLNEALVTLRDNGTLEKLSLQFFGASYVPNEKEWNKIN